MKVRDSRLFGPTEGWRLTQTPYNRAGFVGRFCETPVFSVPGNAGWQSQCLGADGAAPSSSLITATERRGYN
jgi:hypothetical protein